jgi:hypothetical protein
VPTISYVDCRVEAAGACTFIGVRYHERPLADKNLLESLDVKVRLKT